MTQRLARSFADVSAQISATEECDARQHEERARMGNQGRVGESAANPPQPRMAKSHIGKGRDDGDEL